MDRAPLPKAASLPGDIRELALYHKHDVVYESFGRDVQALIAAIETHRRARDEQAAEAARLAREKEQAEIEAARLARQQAKEEAEAERRTLEKEWQAKPRPRLAAFLWKPAAAIVAVAAVVILLIAQPWQRGPTPTVLPEAGSNPVKPVTPQAGRIADKKPTIAPADTRVAAVAPPPPSSFHRQSDASPAPTYPPREETRVYEPKPDRTYTDERPYNGDEKSAFGKGQEGDASQRPGGGRTDGAMETVAPGDTLYSLARRYGVTVDMIARANGLSTVYVRPGTKLFIPRADPASYVQARSTPAIPVQPVCDGLIVAVALPNTRPCIKPGSGESFKDCSDCPDMVAVPAGSFLMGSSGSEEGREENEGPQHNVTIAKPFAVGRTHVMQGEFAQFVKAASYKKQGGCYTCAGTKTADGYGTYNQPPLPDGTYTRPRIYTPYDVPRSDARSYGSSNGEPDIYYHGDDLPVVSVSWDDAQAYVKWLSGKTGKTYRLLSESEFEYAARAGTTTPFWWGESISTDQANYNGNGTYGGSAKGQYRAKSVPVKSFQPNPWGLYQVLGNVRTWVEDCWLDNYKDAPTDGSAAIRGDCSVRVARGGAWDDFPGFLRAAHRTKFAAKASHNVGGLRVARTLE